MNLNRSHFITFYFTLSVSRIFGSAIPEPPVILYGQLSGAGALQADIEWHVSGNSDSVQAGVRQIIQVNSQVYYISEVPFETRNVVGIDPLPATADTFELTSADHTYSLSVSINDEPVILSQEDAVFAYGAFTQGLIKRIDLIFGETFEEWSLRVFGKVVDPDGNEDGDPFSNYQEFLAATNPNDILARFGVRGFTLLSANQAEIAYQGYEGYTYIIEHSLDLDKWVPVSTPVEGFGNLLKQTVNLGNTSRSFYRIVASEIIP